jgi:hypothetical protein
LSRARRFLHDQSLGLVLLAMTLLILGGQTYVGYRDYDEQQMQMHAPLVSYGRYLVSSDLWDNVMSNWQSEFLQIALYVMFAVWFRQRGSAESRGLQDQEKSSAEHEMLGAHLRPDSPRWARAGGWRLRIYSNSLLLSMLVLFVLSWLAMAVTERNVFNDQQQFFHQPAVSFGQFVQTSYFWNRTLQNWQSEFLAIGVFAVTTIYLRQRGSTESKPVGAPHDSTGD